MLLLPDRQAVFGLINDVTTRRECLVAMMSTYTHPHRKLANLKSPDAMHAGGAENRKAPAGFVHDPLAFLRRQCLECFVFEPRHGLAVVVIAHPAFERRIAAGSRIRERVSQ